MLRQSELQVERGSYDFRGDFGENYMLWARVPWLRYIL